MPRNVGWKGVAVSHDMAGPGHCGADTEPRGLETFGKQFFSVGHLDANAALILITFAVKILVPIVLACASTLTLIS